MTSSQKSGLKPEEKTPEEMDSDFIGFVEWLLMSMTANHERAVNTIAHLSHLSIMKGEKDYRTDCREIAEEIISDMDEWWDREGKALSESEKIAVHN